MVTTCAPLAADLFLFCYERYFMLSLSDDNQAAINLRRSALLQDI